MNETTIKDIQMIYQITMLILVMTMSLFLGFWTILITPTPEFNLVWITFFLTIFLILFTLCLCLLLYILFDEEEE